MTYSLEVSSRQPSGAGVTSFPLRITAGDQAVTNQGNNTATLIGLSTENGGGSSRIKCAIGHCRTESADRGSIVFLCNNVNDSNPVTMSDERMRITSTGNVGIGTNNPTTAKLVISGTLSTTGLDMATNDQYAEMRVIRNSISSIDKNVYIGFLAGAGSQIVLYSNNAETLRCNNGAVTNPSDSRIKKDIEDINDATALNKLLLIQPTTYNYIDERNKGFGKVYGFIAQQIREVIPEAVPIIEAIIPNIYKNCLINNKREVYHNIPLDTPIDTEVKIKGSEYKIKEVYEDYFVIDKDIEDVEAFVYGYNINDFHSLNKDYIFTLNVCATQELHRRIEAQSVVIKSQEDRIKDLETKVAILMSNTT